MSRSALEDRWARGDPAVLPELVALWRVHRHPDLAALVQALSGPAHPPAGSTRAERAHALRSAWRDPPSADLPGLLAGLFRVDPDTARLLMARRDPWLDDPRVVGALLDALAAPPPGFGSAVALGFWGEVVRWLRSVPDPTIGARLAAIAPRSWAPATPLHGLVHAVPAPEHPDPSDPPELDALRGWLGRTRRSGVTAEVLLAAVYADPADRAARDVLADHLQEAGDPRGLAIARERAGRSARALADQHGASWLGAIAPMVARASFLGGFADRVVLRPGPLDPTLPEWRTVRIVHVSGRTDAGPLLAVLPLLEAVEGAVALDGVPAHVRRLEARLDESGVRALVRSPAFTGLTELVLTPASSRQAPPSAIGALADLRTLTVRSPDPAWLRAGQDWGGAFPLTLDDGGTWRRTLEPDAHAARTRLVLVAAGPSDGAVLGTMRDAVAGLEAGRLREVVVRLPTRARVLPVQHDIARGQLARLCPQATVVFETG
ncbi:MAG: hypothetical protein R3F61_36970 [Myxococcota bacterium]